MLVGRCSSKLSNHELQAKSKKSQAPSFAEGFQNYFELISRMRAVSALPVNSLKVPNSGESTTLFTTTGFRLPVAFSKTPRRPK